MSNKMTPKLPQREAMSPGGKCHPQFNPHYEVTDQGEPTPSEPVSRRKHARGMAGNAAAMPGPLPSFK